MLNIKLEDINRSKYGKLYINNRSRLASATAVTFLSDERIVIVNLVGMKMYLYQMDYKNKVYKRLHHVDTIYDNKLTVVDLIDFDKKDLIAATNFEAGTQSIYKIVNDKLKHYLDVTNFNKTPQYCHGVKFYPKNKNIICATGNRSFSVDFINYVNKKLLYKIMYDVNYNPKDVAFVNDTGLLVVYTTSEVVDHQTTSSSKSRIIYYQFNLDEGTSKIVDFCDINNSHGDSIVFHKNVIYTNNQICDTVEVLYLKNNKINYYKNLKGYSFPHGISVSDKFIAVSNYGDNTVKIIEQPDDIKTLMAA